MKKIKIGRVTGALGLRGEVKIYHDSGDDEAIRRLDSLFLSGAGEHIVAGGFTRYKIDGLRTQRRTPVLKLSGVDDRDAAEALIGSEVFADEDESRPDEEGAFLVSDLVGLEARLVTHEPSPFGIVTHEPSPFGTFGMRVRGVISNPAHDILEIEAGGEVRLLPFIDEFIGEIDLKGGYIIICPPEGWLG